MYRYDTHVHTAPVSRCGRATVRETLEFYKDAGFDGIFITNHFLDGNVNIDRALTWEEMPYEERLNFYCSDYEEAVRLSSEIGIRVFFGVELTYGGTDFLIYGLDKDWYMAHPEIMQMEKSAELTFMQEEGALVVQAHPFREAAYIDHIRLYHKSVQGVETINANRKDTENRLAEIYAEAYGFVRTAGTDNHAAGKAARIAGMASETPLRDELDFKERVLSGSMKLFVVENTWND